ncbi:MAG: phosphotransferase [Pirellulaceae bacterium]
MLSAANHSIVIRNRDLAGLATLLDANRTAEQLMQCGLPLDGPLHIDYLRYKPGRRCISLVTTSIAGTEQRFVLTALPESTFVKQQARAAAAESETMHWQAKSWQDSVQRIRIDQFPFDLGLRHIEKCFDSGERRRLLRRVLGKDTNHADLHLETLAYKPSRRYVAAGMIANDCAAQTSDSMLPSTVKPIITFKFYSRSQFSQTWQRLQSVQDVFNAAPRTVASHERYKVIAMEWIQGNLLADLIASGQDADTLFFDVGSALARLHRCDSVRGAPAAAAGHALDDIASYIGFICPHLAELANRTINDTVCRLVELRKPRALIHGDFYAKQVLIDRDATHDAVRFIDFDQAGLGNPYQDVGNFVAKLYWQQLVLGQNISAVEEMAEPFLTGYRSGVGEFDEQAYRAQLSAGLIRCATHPFRRAMFDWPAIMCQLLMLARHVLQATSSHPEPVSLT